MSKKLSPEIKAEICTHFEHGMTQVQIAQKYLITQATVSKTLKRYAQRGTYARKHGSGRPSKLSKEDLEFFEKKIEENPKLGSNKLKVVIEEEKGIVVSARSIRRNLCDIGLFGRVACKKPLLSSDNISSRLEHSLTWINYKQEDWDRIIWSDETKINLFGSDGRTYVRRKVGTRYHSENLKPTVKFGGGNVMVWGCFSSKGVGKIAFVDGKMDADQYCRILDSCLPESQSKLGMTDFVFQQDNDPKHTSKTCKEYLTIKKVKTMSWPSQSPDMNPIENIWSILKRKVELRTPKNMANLKEIIVQEWNSIPQEICKKIVDSMHKRAYDLWFVKGKHTKY